MARVVKVKVAMSRPKRWIADLLEQREKLQRTLGMPVGESLGCGYYGCVFRSSEPWVIKLTIDRSEGPIWEKIVNITEEEDYGAEGFARVKDIVRLLPDVQYGGKKHKLYAIVREDCPPVFEFPRGKAHRPSAYTMQRLGLPEVAAEWHGLRGEEPWWQSENELREYLQEQHDYPTPAAERTARQTTAFSVTVRALLSYRNLELQARSAVRDRFGYLDRPRYSRSELKDRLERAAYRMSGEVGNYLGESLNLLLSRDIILRDLHLGNIGWRRHETIAGSTMPPCLVIYDPGHTPTAGRSNIEERMVANARWPA
jgi:hypothetical protein